MQVRPVPLQDFSFGDPKKLVLIGGPCVIESESSAMNHAEKIMKIAEEVKISYVFKASYDKANRSSIHSLRGPGLKEGLKILAKVKAVFELPILSDIHSIEQVK